MDDLIKRLENADEGSRELDIAIADECKIQLGGSMGDWDWRPEDTCPRYTTSIDDAVSLIPEGYLLMLNQRAVRSWEAILSHKDTRISFNISGKNESTTAELAICIAALRARAGGE